MSFNFRKGKWCAEEDALLLAAFEEHGKAWVKVAEAVPGRTQRQCRTRWLALSSYPKEKTEELITAPATPVKVEPEPAPVLAVEPVPIPFALQLPHLSNDVEEDSNWDDDDFPEETCGEEEEESDYEEIPAV